MSLILATEAGFGDPFGVPEDISVLFDFPAIFFEGTPFAVNRTVLIMGLATVIAITLMLSAFPGKTIPGKFQSAMEALVDFVREQIILPVMGREGLSFLPLFTTIFLFVWLNNLFGILPLFNFPPTSRMAYPAMMAALIWVMFVVVGIVKQGPKYFWNVAFPPGVPKAIYILVTPIELVSTFIVRPLTLAVRLFANMMAGHILLTIIFLTIHAFLPNPRGFAIGIVGLAAAPLMIGFELVVGILQAYIMTILAAVYIGSSMHAEH